MATRIDHQFLATNDPLFIIYKNPLWNIVFSWIMVRCSDGTIIESNRKIDSKCWDQIKSSSWYWDLTYDTIMQSPELCNDSYRNSRCHFTGTGIRRLIWGSDTLWATSVGRERGRKFSANYSRLEIRLDTLHIYTVMSLSRFPTINDAATAVTTQEW